MLLAIRNDFLSDAPGKTGDMTQKLRTCRVDVDADKIHAVFHNRRKAALKLLMIHIMLILTHADCLGVNLHKFSQRILKTSCNGNRPAVADVELGKFLTGKLGSRINGSSRLADDDALRLDFRMRAQNFAYNSRGFPACRPVPNRNESDSVGLEHFQELQL